MVVASSRWSAEDIPSQLGRTAVVTGAGSGLGLAAATGLAKRQATVVLACRDPDKAKRAADRIRADSPESAVRIVRVDLASLASVHEAASEIRTAFPRVHLLVNNAGVMWPPYARSPDGFELTLATNHLGPFAFTGLLLDNLLAALNSRIVTVSSVVYREGVINFDDLNFGREYRPAAAYAQSKLANLLFTYELSDRLGASCSTTIALAAHPGVARTNLFKWNPPPTRVLLRPELRPFMFWMAQDVRIGALAILRAATDPYAKNGEFYGPSGWRGYTGLPIRTKSADHSYDATARRRLWEISESLTGVSFLSRAVSDS